MEIPQRMSIETIKSIERIIEQVRPVFGEVDANALTMILQYMRLVEHTNTLLVLQVNLSEKILERRQRLQIVAHHN